MDEIYTTHHALPLEQFVAEALTYGEYTPVEVLHLRALCKIADTLANIERKMKG